MQRQRNAYYKKIEFVFYHESEIRKAVAACDAIEKPLCRVAVCGGWLEWPESWLKMCDVVYAWCDDEHLAVAKRRYRGEDSKLTCIELCMSDTTRRRYLDDVRHFADLVATQLGLIKHF